LAASLPKTVKTDPPACAAQIAEGGRGAGEELQIDHRFHAEPAQPKERLHRPEHCPKQPARIDGNDVLLRHDIE